MRANGPLAEDDDGNEGLEVGEEEGNLEDIGSWE